MIKIENISTFGWEEAIRGMRNPMNSWDRSDTAFWSWPSIEGGVAHQIGSNDMNLMTKLRDAGTDHRKFMRMIVVYMDITAPLYWWKEFDTYKIGTVSNSCSTMHKITDKEFTIDDFSHEHLTERSLLVLDVLIRALNDYLDLYLEKPTKEAWWQIIQLLPSSYNQKRTIMMNYEVCANIYNSRKKHKLDEWKEFCDWVSILPYSNLIIDQEKGDTK